MPAIIWREETLNGAAEICLVKDRNSYFLRTYRGGRKYSFSSLKTSDLELARKKALEVYIEVQGSGPKSRSKSYLLETAMEEWLKEKEQEVSSKELRPGSLDTYRQRIFQRILPYAKLQGVRNIGDLTKTTFLDYKKHYQGVSEKGRWGEKSDGLSASTINSDISTLQTILKWMVHKDLLDANLNPEFKKVRDKKDYRESSNPALYPKDWQHIVNWMPSFIGMDCDYMVPLEDFKEHNRNPQKFSKTSPYLRFSGQPDKFREYWRRQHFIHYVLWQYETGCRPDETNTIRFRDIEVRENEFGSGKIVIRIIPDNKTGKRNTIARSATYHAIRFHKIEGLKFRTKEIEEHNLAVEEGRKKGKIQPLPGPLVDDDFLFFNPFQQSGKRTNYSDIWYNDRLKELLELTTTDPDFPQDAVKTYTKYSLRSSHITHELLRGTDIDKIAENVGTSRTEIERTYKRRMNELNIDYLARERAVLMGMTVPHSQ